MARTLIAAGAAFLALGIGLGGFQVFQRYQSAVEKQQVDAYTAAVLPPAQAAGRLVSQSIVPELSAYEASQTAGAKVAADAAAWQAAFVKTRGTFAAAAHPGKLGPIAARFDDALAKYAAAVAFFARLGDAGAAPAAFVAGETVAAAADRAYGLAVSALGCLRASLGLPLVPEFRAAGACPAG